MDPPRTHPELYTAEAKTGLKQRMAEQGPAFRTSPEDLAALRSFTGPHRELVQDALQGKGVPAPIRWGCRSRRPWCRRGTPCRRLFACRHPVQPL